MDNNKEHKQRIDLLLIALKKLKEYQDNISGIDEKVHVEADKLLLMYINNKEVTELFEGLEKWYV